MNLDLFQIKSLMIECAELGAAMTLKTLQPKSDDLTQNQAYAMFGEGWIRTCKAKGLIKGKRKGPAKNSPIYFSKAELMAVLNAQKAQRFGIFSDTNI